MAHIVCPACDAVNRVPEEKLAADPHCGKCHRHLFPGQPIALDEARFLKHITQNDIPVLVDFWAPWCAPCRMMAPAFEQAAKALEPQVRLAKVNTEQERNLAIQYGIRSIPTLVLFRKGQEVDRISGALDLGRLIAWTRQHF
ncbi:MAG: thioredoxin TrxC [Gammaproteobacteria bacterium]|nr:MAG: thioredoxin TrxC [Gammaproteobacteria bacterium]